MPKNTVRLKINGRPLAKIARDMRATRAQARKAGEETVISAAGTARKDSVQRIASGTGLARTIPDRRVLTRFARRGTTPYIARVVFSGQRIPIKKFRYQIIPADHPTRAYWRVWDTIGNSPNIMRAFVNPLGAAQASLIRYPSDPTRLFLAGGITIIRPFEEVVTSAPFLTQTQRNLQNRFAAIIRRQQGGGRRTTSR